MDIERLVNRALTDEGFANELRRQAAASAAAGVSSDAWKEFAGYFADTPEELDELVPPQDEVARIRWTTITTLTTVTTAGCATTTTTTTTTEVPRFCKEKKAMVELADEVVIPLARFPIEGHREFKGKQG